VSARRIASASSPVVVVLLAAGLLLGGCGGDDDGARGPEAGATADSRAVEALAQRYIAALAAGDQRAACATRARRDRLGLARRAGTCERAFSAIMATTDFEPLWDARIRTATVRGDRASVTYEAPGDAGGPGRLLAIKDGGRWGLIGEESLRKPDADGPVERRPARVQGRPCPRGTRLVRPADLVDDLPAGYELADAAEEPPLVDFLRVALRGRLRRAETKVLLRAPSEFGTGVTVVNFRERHSDRVLADIVAGARAAGADKAERIEIAGGEGALMTGPGAVTAMAVVGPCAVVHLTDDDEAGLLRAAALLHRP
jgi:uncharacterized protein (DUF433 family)